MATPEEEKAEQDRIAAEAAEKEKAEADKENAAKDFDEWLSKQPENVQKLYEQKTGGLKSALENERKTNKANKEALKKLADLEEAETKRREAELSETEKLNARLTEAEAKRAEAEKQLADQRATIAAEKSFGASVAKLNLDFYNDKARENVFRLMDVSKPDGFEAALKELNEAEPYYFKAKEIPDLDSKRKDKSKNGEMTDADKAALKKRFNIK